MDIQKLGMKQRVVGPQREVLPRVVEALKNEGFGILSEIDVEKTLREKLGVERGPYTILGACHPPSAHAVLQAEPEAGLLLPCNVVVYADGDAETVVSAFDPMVIAESTPALASIARDVAARLRKAMQALG